MPFIDIKARYRPVLAQSNRVDKLLLMIVEVIIILCLVEETDIHCNPIMLIGTRILVTHICQPCLVLSDSVPPSFFFGIKREGI